MFVSTAIEGVQATSKSFVLPRLAAVDHRTTTRCTVHQDVHLNGHRWLYDIILHLRSQREASFDSAMSGTIQRSIDAMPWSALTRTLQLSLRTGGKRYPMWPVPFPRYVDKAVVGASSMSMSGRDC